MKKLLPWICISLTACTSVSVKPIDQATGIEHVCIKENPKVIVSDFLPVVREAFYKHGIATQVFSGSMPKTCEYVLTYTALQSWDFSPYLSHAELYLERAGRQVGSAEYHLNGKGGFSLTKWQGTKAKIEPVIDKLLAK